MALRHGVPVEFGNKFVELVVLSLEINEFDYFAKFGGSCHVGIPHDRKVLTGRTSTCMS